MSNDSFLLFFGWVVHPKIFGDITKIFGDITNNFGDHPNACLHGVLVYVLEAGGNFLRWALGADS